MEYLLALGSNLGDRNNNIKLAVDNLKQVCEVTGVAQIHETAPVGLADKMFLNTCLTCRSNLEPEDFLKALLEIESKLGRTRARKWENRIIDIDILLVKKDDQFLSHSDDYLKVPHPRMLERPFVMIPALEIAAAWIHPKTGKTLEQSWSV